MKFRNQWNYDNSIGHCEKVSGVSLTIPDQTLSVQEILARYTRGLPFDSAKVPLYEEEGEEGFPDFDKMDLAEIQEYMEEFNKEVSERMAQKKAEKEAADKKRMNDEYEAEVDRRMKSKADQVQKSERTKAQNPDQGTSAP